MLSSGLKKIPFLLGLICVEAAGQNIDSLARQRVEARETPGIVVGVYAEGKTTYYSYGLADLETQEKANPKTLFEIGSVTKTFTCLIAALMVEKGKWSLEDPVQKFLPAEARMPEKNGKQITIENLATARSGLPRMPDNFFPANPQNPYIDYTQKQLFEFLGHYTLTEEPGSKYEYSNLGMALLGYTVAFQNHMPYKQLIEEWITHPLHMDHTVLNLPDKKLQNLAHGYFNQIPVNGWTWTDESAMAGAGGLVSNAEDMMTYLIANLNESSALGPSMKMTHQPRHDAGSIRMQIGLGWHILNNKIIWHNGATGGFRAFAGFNPSTKMAVVILTNSNTGADDLGFYLLDNSQPLKNIRATVNVDEKILKQYVGDYEITPQFKIAISLADGTLFAQATGQDKLELFPESEKKFYMKAMNAQIEFIRNEFGNVEKLLLHQDGAAHSAVKIK